jgi:hypothetical protein
VGGNLGTNFRSTAQLLARTGEPIVFCAVLHHDGCLAARAGLQVDLDVTAREIAVELARLKLPGEVVMGRIRTEHNHLLWLDEPERRYVPFTFGSG